MNKTVLFSVISYLVLLGVYGLWDWLMFTKLAKKHYAEWYTLGMTDFRAAAVIYVLYPLSIMYLTRSPTWEQSVWKGAILGLTVYGIYHLTNKATLTQWPVPGTKTSEGWPWTITAIDTASGVAITTLLAGIHFLWMDDEMRKKLAEWAKFRAGIQMIASPQAENWKNIV